jgi:hypothetical protein
MNPLVCMPLYHWLSWVAALVVVIGVAVGMPVGVFCAYAGAKKAIKMCSRQNGCAMRIEEERNKATQDLTEQVRRMREANPELAALHEAARRALNDTGEHQTIPEAKG